MEDLVENAILRQYLDPKRVDIALRVANHIKDNKLPLDMKNWKCGTTACLMGWMGSDKECNDLGLFCPNNNGPIYNGMRLCSEYNFFMREGEGLLQFIEDNETYSIIKYAIDNILMASSYYASLRLPIVTIEAVIGKLEELKEILSQ